jgi:hypothetical protein
VRQIAKNSLLGIAGTLAPAGIFGVSIALLFRNFSQNEQSFALYIWLFVSSFGVLDAGLMKTSISRFWRSKRHAYTKDFMQLAVYCVSLSAIYGVIIHSVQGTFLPADGPPGRLSYEIPLSFILILSFQTLLSFVVRAYFESQNCFLEANIGKSVFIGSLYTYPIFFAIPGISLSGNLSTNFQEEFLGGVILCRTAALAGMVVFAVWHMTGSRRSEASARELKPQGDSSRITDEPWHHKFEKLIVAIIGVLSFFLFAFDKMLATSIVDPGDRTAFQYIQEISTKVFIISGAIAAAYYVELRSISCSPGWVTKFETRYGLACAFSASVVLVGSLLLSRYADTFLNEGLIKASAIYLLGVISSSLGLVFLMFLQYARLYSLILAIYCAEALILYLLTKSTIELTATSVSTIFFLRAFFDMILLASSRCLAGRKLHFASEAT